MTTKSNRGLDDRWTSEEFPDTKGRLPEGGHIANDLRLAVLPIPTISRYIGTDKTKKLILGECPLCKDQMTDWEQMKKHYERCQRVLHFPLLMRTCYCPFCRKKQSDGYSLSNHIQHNHEKNLMDCRNGEFKMNLKREAPGVLASKMRCPFPFYCTSCKRCWSNAKMIAEHFVKNEERGTPCKGTIHLLMFDRRGEPRRGIVDDPRIICRYEFPNGVFCPYCEMSFTEAYELSRHCQSRHSETMKQLRLRLVDAIATVPVKAYFYEPFVCSMCHTRYRSTESWARHIQDRIYEGKPCFGELRVMKFSKEISGFVSNMFSHRSNEMATEAEMIRRALDLPDPTEETTSPPPPPAFPSLPPPTSSIHINDRFIRFDGSLSQPIKRELMGMEEEPDVKMRILKSEVEVLSHSKPDPNAIIPCKWTLWDRVFRIDNDSLRRKVDEELRNAEEDRRLRNVPYIASQKEFDFKEEYRRLTENQVNPQPIGMSEGIIDDAIKQETVVKEEPVDESEETGVIPKEELPHSVVGTTTPSKTNTLLNTSFEDTHGYFSTRTESTQPKEQKIKDEPVDEEPTRVKDEPMDEHEVKEEAKDSFTCEECNAVFDEETKLERHMNIHRHEEERRIIEEQMRPPMSLEFEPDARRVPRMDDNDDISRYFRTAVSSRFPSFLPSTTPLVSKYPPLVTPKATASSMWNPCPSCPVMCTSISDFKRHRTESHPPELNRVTNISLTHGCVYCRRFRCATIAEKKSHEKDCSVYKLTEIRERQLGEAHGCPYCKRRQESAYVLGAHIMVEHADILRTLRFHHLMASEFLPFRCTKCMVGFEEPRMLLNHFRLKEEFGNGCDGILKVHNYQESLMLFNKMTEQREQPLIPRLPYLDELDDDENDTTRPSWVLGDVPPLPLPRNTWTTRCPHCPEHWPREQIRTHVKYDHPAHFFSYSPFKCKICKQYGFYCSKHYAIHYESCNPLKPGIHDERSSACAPRCLIPAKPSALHNDLKNVPWDIGNVLRQCRLCPGHFTPIELLIHQKVNHTVSHFTEAPYQCLQCNLIGFYNHMDYKAHLSTCTGVLTEDQTESIFAISMIDVNKYTDKQRSDFPTYMSLLEEERAKYGTMASLHRSNTCPICGLWNSSLYTLAEHYRDCHRMKDGVPFLCGGCGTVFGDILLLKQHLKNQVNLGNSQCFDTASITNIAPIMNNCPRALVVHNQPLIHPRRDVAPPPLVSTGYQRQHSLGVSPIVRNWRQEVNLERPKRVDYKIKPPQKLLTERTEDLFARPLPPTKLIYPLTPSSVLASSPLMSERLLYRKQVMDRAKARNYQNSSLFREEQARRREEAAMGASTSRPLPIAPRMIPGRGMMIARGGMRAPSVPIGGPSTSTGRVTTSLYASNPSLYRPSGFPRHLVNDGERPKMIHRLSPSPSTSNPDPLPFTPMRVTVAEQRAIEAAHYENERIRALPPPKYSSFNFVPASQARRAVSCLPPLKRPLPSSDSIAPPIKKAPPKPEQD